MQEQSKPPQQKIAIIGGGLAGCLALHALNHLNQKLESESLPIFQLFLFEKNSQLCGNHTWSFHENDIPEGVKEWLNPLISHSWSQYDVFFPEVVKQLNSGYLSIKSQDLAEKTNALSQSKQIKMSFNEDCKILSEQSIEVQNKILHFDYVIDARGWRPHPSPSPLDGYQKFVGLEVELQNPHGLESPIVMDARVEQIDGYRFMYALPLTNKEVLLEDTYYSNSHELNEEVITQRIHQYALARQWEIKQIKYKEKGCLLIPAKLNQQATTAVITLGVSGNQYQPVTGYSTPYILSDIQFLIELLIQKSPYDIIQKELLKKRQTNKLQTLFYTLLNRMLFGAAEPEKRYIILQRFYKFDNALIQRFYSGRTTFWDMCRILSGRPPVSVWRALQVIFSR